MNEDFLEEDRSCCGGGFGRVLVCSGFGVISQHLWLRSHRELDGSRRVVKDVQLALNNWITEYDELPLLRREPVTEDIESEVSGEIVAALLGECVAGNQRGIPFLELRSATPKRVGLKDQEGQLLVVDQWGTPIRFLLDGDGDNKLPNPDMRNRDEAIRSSSPERLRTRVAVFSAGKDRVFFTKDDLVSWR